MPDDSRLQRLASRNSRRLLLIDSLRRQTVECLADLVKPQIDEDAPFALLDFPEYDNVGDSAIYCGELAYFRGLGKSPAYVSSKDRCSWERLDAAVGDGTIFLQGGGNFGDLWPWFQTFREDVLKRYPSRRVVQLPQTLHYSSQESIDQTARVIETHGAFTLLVRDRRSYEVAQRHFPCEVRLCPDMAFQLGPMPTARAQYDLLLHLRTDKETTGAAADRAGINVAGVVQSDWPKEGAGWQERFDRKRLPWLGFAYLTGGRESVRSERYRGRANARLRRGFDLLRSSRMVITDRLHGHIMTLLLGIPHCVLDNSYGKTSSFMSAWGTDIDGVYRAASVAEAMDILRREEGLSVASP